MVRQIIDLIPKWIFNRCVDQHQSDKGCSKYKAYDQFAALSLGQFYKSYTLGDIATNIAVSEMIVEHLKSKKLSAYTESFLLFKLVSIKS